VTSADTLIFGSAAAYDPSWTLATPMSGAGAFIVNGDGSSTGMITINQANTGMTGPTTIEAGVLELTNASGVGSGGITVTTAAHDLSTGLKLNLSTSGTLNNVLSGAGSSTVASSSQLATIAGASSAYTGDWEIAGPAAVAATSTSSNTNLGSGSVDIASSGTLTANTNGTFSFNNPLTGTGTLAASNNGVAFSFGPTATVGTAFQGTVVLSAAIDDARTLTVEVEDRGKGIADLEQAMQPFYTSHPELERSGMGFAVMQSCLDALEVTSTVGEGTRVRMRKHFARAEK
jgi:hypothetical protein